MSAFSDIFATRFLDTGGRRSFRFLCKVLQILISEVLQSFPSFTSFYLSISYPHALPCLPFLLSLSSFLPFLMPFFFPSFSFLPFLEEEKTYTSFSISSSCTSPSSFPPFFSFSLSVRCQGALWALFVDGPMLHFLGYDSNWSSGRASQEENFQS